jgi:arylsulfatase A-like enzyme
MDKTLDRTILPLPEPQSPPITEIDARKAKAPARFELKPPKGAGAPNVVFILMDNFGFGDPGCFGGPVNMPALERLAKGGLRYNNMHTAPVCSPTRVAMLTGRNSHSANMGGVAEMGTAFPGMNCARPQSIAPLAEVLRLNGYGTAMFGKCHELPPWELSVSGPMDRWPVHSGFDKFYGFLQGEADLYSPPLYDGVTRIPTPRDADYHVSTDISDKAIVWVRTQQSLTPEKPFFIYYSAAGTHDPHHVPKKWIEKYKGKFDQGWEKLREETLARQIKLGTVPPGTRLAPMPDIVQPWDSFKPEEKRVLAREMEVYAAMAEHTDHEIGRVIQAIEDLGELDNTLIVWVAGDNGGSPFGGPIGSFNQLATFNGVPETMDNLLKHIDDLGGPKASGHYAMPWGQASCTPMVGGQGHATFSATRNATVIHWPEAIKAKGEIRTQFQHVIDLAPTVLEAAGLPEPKVVNGMTQRPMEGGSLLHTFNDAKAKSRHTTQYFEYGGNRSIYHDGWYAMTLHKAFWEAAPRATFENDVWELYKPDEDFSLINNLAAKFPEKVEELKALFMKEAVKYSVLPLDDRVLERFNASIAGRPTLMGSRTSLTLYEGMSGLTENAFIDIKNRSYTLTAELDVPESGAEGVVIAHGGHTGGWSLYVKNGNPKFVYNWLGREIFEVPAARPLPKGKITLRWEFIYDGGKMPGAGGRGDFFINGEPAGSGRIGRTIPFFIGTETADVGVDDLTPVTHDYKAYDNRFTGTIRKIVIGVAPIGEAFDPPLEWNGVG